MAHPEPRFGGEEEGEEEEEEEEGHGSYSGRRAPSATPGASVLSTSSFSPPQPLMLLAVRPLGRVRPLAGGGRAGPQGEHACSCGPNVAGTSSNHACKPPRKPRDPAPPTTP